MIIRSEYYGHPLLLSASFYQIIIIINLSYYKWPTDPVHYMQAGCSPGTAVYMHSAESHLSKMLLSCLQEQMQTERRKDHFLVVSLQEAGEYRVGSSPGCFPCLKVTPAWQQSLQQPHQLTGALTVSQLHQITPICHFYAVKVNHPLTLCQSKCLQLNTRSQ